MQHDVPPDAGSPEPLPSAPPPSASPESASPPSATEPTSTPAAVPQPSWPGWANVWARRGELWRRRGEAWSARGDHWKNRRALWTARPRVSLLHRGVLGVLLVFLAFGLLNVRMLAKYRPADEPRHAAYALLLMDGKWPKVSDPLPYDALQTGRLNSGNVVAAANHPPLFYWYVGPVLESASKAQQMDLGIRRARYMVLALGAVSLVYMFRIIRLFFPRHPAIALAGMAMVATLPAYINTVSIVYNDALGILTTAGAFHGAMRLLVMGKTRWRLVVTGVWMALAVFTRISGLFVVMPALLVAGIAVLVHTEGKWWRRLLHAALVCTAYVVGMVALSGWFYWRNYKLYGDVTASGELLRLFGRRPHGTTMDLLLSDASWESMLNGFFGRLAGGVSLKNGVERLCHWACFIPLAALPIAALRMGSQARQVIRDRRWFGVLGGVLALVFILVPMFMYHAKGGNLNGRYAFAIIWFPAMILAAGLASFRSSTFAVASVTSFFAIGLWVVDLYARALTKRGGAEASVPFALEANGVRDPWAAWLWAVLLLVAGFALVVHAIAKLHRRMDEGDADAAAAA
ncbi:MAG: hypothetical protein U0414_02250 [Polyangiaceae bacterium]